MRSKFENRNKAQARSTLKKFSTSFLLSTPRRSAAFSVTSLWDTRRVAVTVSSRRSLWVHYSRRIQNTVPIYYYAFDTGTNNLLREKKDPGGKKEKGLRDYSNLHMIRSFHSSPCKRLNIPLCVKYTSSISHSSCLSL